ncbi:MAG: hypothetical protein QG635_435, partial [Bacteroidota bacterium]|nr:hypothetical protein [Bacteroidota bacterium]
MGIGLSGVVLNMRIFIILIILFSSMSFLYSQEGEELIDIEKKVKSTKDTSNVEIPKEIKVPRFDVHASINYFIFLNFGIRTLINDNISLKLDGGICYFVPIGFYFRFGLNYHTPIWHPLVISFDVKNYIN